MLSSMVVGSVWYAPKVFGRRWMTLARIDPSHTGGAVRAISITVAVSFITAWVLAGAVFVTWTSTGAPFFITALIVAVLLWAGFTAARFITHDAFESRPATLTVLNIAHELVTVLVMAIIIGLWPPAGI